MLVEATRPRPTKLRRYLLEHGLTNQAVADSVGVSPYWMSQVVLGRTRGSARLRARIAAALGAAEAELF